MQANSSRLGKKILKYILFINLLFIPLTTQAFAPNLGFAIEDAEGNITEELDFGTIFVSKNFIKKITIKNTSTHNPITVLGIQFGLCGAASLPLAPSSSRASSRAINIITAPYSLTNTDLTLPITIEAVSSSQELQVAFAPTVTGESLSKLCFSYEAYDTTLGYFTKSSTNIDLVGTGAQLKDDADKFSLTEDAASTQIIGSTGDLLANDENLAAHFKIERVEAIQGGSVVLNADQTISFEPNANYNSAASFKYVVKDDAGNEASAVVTGTISAVNDPPVLKPSPPNMSGSTPEDTALTIPATNLLTNFTDPDSGDTLSLDSVSNPKNGTVTQNGGNVIFTPTKDFVGTASFDYTVTDGKSPAVKATFTVTVTEEVNKAPVLKPSPPNMSGSTPEDTALTIPATNLLTNFTDPDSGDTLSLDSVSNPKNGTVTQNGGNVIFTPTKDFVGTASFEYTVKDSKGATAKATFSITVAEVDEPLILKGNNQPIANGGATTSSVNCTDLGSARVVGETKTCEYTLTNSNSIPINVTIEQAEVPNSTASFWESATQALNQLNPIKAAWAVGFADFSMSTRSLTVPANGSASFLVVFDPSATGLRESLINLIVDGEIAHSFLIVGNGVAEAIPIFNPLVLLALLAGLFWLGRRFKTN